MTEMIDFIMKSKEVCKMTSLSIKCIQEKVREGFWPRPIYIGKARVGWWHSEVVEMVNYGMDHPDEDIRAKAMELMSRRGRGGRRRVLVMQPDGTIANGIIE